MKTGKQEAMELLASLPDEAPSETILAEMHFKLRAPKGIAEADRGELVSQSQVEADIDRWVRERQRSSA